MTRTFDEAIKELYETFDRHYDLWSLRDNTGSLLVDTVTNAAKTSIDLDNAPPELVAAFVLGASVVGGLVLPTLFSTENEFAAQLLTRSLAALMEGCRGLIPDLPDAPKEDNEDNCFGYL